MISNNKLVCSILLAELIYLTTSGGMSGGGMSGGGMSGGSGGGSGGGSRGSSGGSSGGGMTPGSNCGMTDYTYSENGEYVLVNCGFTSWASGDDYCYSNFRTGLATITNEEEDEIVSDLCLLNDVFADACWFGAFNIESCTNFEWADGTPVDPVDSYTNWLKSLGWPQGGNACGVLYKADGMNFGWIDSECDTFLEIDIPIVCNGMFFLCLRIFLFCLFLFVFVSVCIFVCLG